jgi:glucose/mannose-6-phosphate isomerase
MLDDINVLKQRDPSGALTIASKQYEQANYSSDIVNGGYDERMITSVVVAGMGGSALAALLVKSWLKLELAVPIEVVRTYDLPAYVSQSTLVIASSYSGNTEETLSCLKQAESKGAQIAIIASGGKLIEQAKANGITYTALPVDFQPRMAVIYNLRALVSLLVNFNIVSSTKLDQIASKSDWLQSETAKWASDVPTADNYAKQLALQAVGKTAVFYGGTLTMSLSGMNCRSLIIMNSLVGRHIQLKSRLPSLISSVI